MKKANFLIEYLKNPSEIGAIAPSSRFLINKYIEEMDFKKTGLVIELGAGNGNFTKAVLKKLNKSQKLLSFETNKKLFTCLENMNNRRLTAINDKAENMETYLKQYKLGKADYILSELPLNAWDKKTAINIIETAKRNLAPGGKYIQFTYLPKNHLLFKKYFKNIKIKYVLLNIPPAFVYICGD